MKLAYLVGLAGVTGAWVAAQDAGTLLDKSTKQLQTATSLSVDYTVQNLPGGPVEYKLKLAKPAKFRFETPDEVMVGDGTTVTTYKKASNSYTQVPQESADVKALLKRDAVLAWTAFFSKDAFKDATNVKVGEKRIIKGKPVTEVTLLIPGKPDKNATFFIDDSLGIPRGVALKYGFDKQAIVMAKDISLSADATMDTDFQFSAPDGAKKVDPSAFATVTFDKVETIFQANCVGCHGSNRPRAGLDLSTYSSTMAGGRGGKDVVAGDPDSSPLMAFLKANGKPQMPPGGPLSDGDIATIAGWIKGGALEK